MAKVLLGFMGAGKSTLAAQLDAHFVDMDALLEERLGMSIASYFAEKGEASFRQAEHQLLSELLQTESVISTGGGIVVDPKNRQLLQENAQNIYLKADFETLYQRLLADKKNVRPLFLNHTKEELAAIFQQREAWYHEVATQVVSVSQRSIQEIVEEIK